MADDATRVIRAPKAPTPALNRTVLPSAPLALSGSAIAPSTATPVAVTVAPVIAPLVVIAPAPVRTIRPADDTGGEDRQIGPRGGGVVVGTQIRAAQTASANLDIVANARAINFLNATGHEEHGLGDLDVRIDATKTRTNQDDAIKVSTGDPVAKGQEIVLKDEISYGDKEWVTYVDPKAKKTPAPLVDKRPIPKPATSGGSSLGLFAIAAAVLLTKV